MYADIIIDITHEKLDKIFQYRIPSHLEGMLKIGMEVLVPFGRYNKETKGYVTGFSEKVDYDPERIKEISGIVEGSIAIEAKLVALAAWMKEYYGGTMIQALKTVIPIKRQERTRKRRTVVLKLSEEEGKEKLKLYLHKNQKARARLLSGLLEQPGQDYELLTKKLHVTAAVIKALEEQGVIEVQTEQMFRNPIPAAAKEKESVTLTGEQQKAVETFWQDYEQGRTGTYLVYGVTGSGKTQVFLRLIDQTLAEGRRAIVMVPEISLTPHGHEFYSYAVELLNTRSRAVMSMKNLKEDLDGILEIQTSSIPGYFYLPQVMEEFHELFPRVRFYVEQSDSRLVNENLMTSGESWALPATRETAACALSLCSTMRWYSSLLTRTYTGSTRMERPSRWSCSSMNPSSCGRTDLGPGRKWKRPWFMGSLCLKTWM